ncbi:MAG: AraC family transcriptional regulator, partial [Verrucomicrobiota bacterium]
MTETATEKSLPSEVALSAIFTKQDRSYKDCRRWWLDDPERLRWMNSPSPVLAGLQVFSCGQFVEALGHMWERANLAEGVLIYCVDGMGYYQNDDNDWAVGPGDLLYAAPNTHHCYWADGQQPWTIYWMHLTGSLLPHYENLLGLIERGPVLHLGVHPEILAEFTRLITQTPGIADEETRWFGAQSAATSILGHIAALPHNMAEIATAYGPVRKAVALMNASLDLPFDMPRFAREAGFSVRHFCRQFRNVTGFTPGEHDAGQTQA